MSTVKPQSLQEKDIDLLHSTLGAQGDRVNWVMIPPVPCPYIHFKKAFYMCSKYLLQTYTETSVSNTQVK